MEPTQDLLSHTTQGRNNTTSMPSRISTALFQDPALVWGKRRLEENHTFLQRVESLREETAAAAAAAEVSSWPPPTSQDSLLARTTHRPLRSYYTTMESVMCISEPGCSSCTFAFFVHFNHENCFNPLLEKELLFLHRQILDASTKAFTFSTFCISLSYNMKYYPQLEKKSNFDWR